MSAHTHLGSLCVEDAPCVSADILGHVMKCPKGVKSEDWLAVRAAIGLFVRQVRGTDLHYHNIIGNNRDGLMHVFGLAPMAYGAVMLTAGVLKFRKARGNEDDQLLSLNKGNWESIMADAEITDTGEITSYGHDKTHVVSIGTTNPNRAESLNNNRFRWDDIMTAKDQFSSNPPIPPPRRNTYSLRVAFQSAVAPHVLGGYELLQFEANRSVLEEGKKFARAIGSDEPCAREYDANDADDADAANDASVVLEDDSDDEDYDPAEDQAADHALDVELEEEFLRQYDREAEEIDAAASSNEPLSVNFCSEEPFS